MYGQRVSDEAKEVAEQILEQLYREAEPGGDYHELRPENPSEEDEGWFNEHKLDHDRMQDIIDDRLDDADLSQVDERWVRKRVNLGDAPKSIVTANGDTGE